MIGHNICKGFTPLKGFFTQTSSGWYFEVQPGDAMIRLVLLIDNTAFISSVVHALKTSYTINDLVKSDSFCFLSAYDFHTWSNQINLFVHAFSCVTLTKHSDASTSLIVWLVLHQNIIIGGNINPSAATVRTAATCLFSEPEVRIITDFWPFWTNDFSGTISKNAGFSVHITYQGK